MLLATERRHYIEELRGRVPDNLVERLEIAYKEIDRVNAIASEIPGGLVEERHRLGDALEALEDAQRALDEIERYLDGGHERAVARFLRRLAR